MARHERLKADRALSIHQRKHLRLVTTPADDRDHRDTDRASAEMPVAERITLPPEAPTNVRNERPEMPPPARMRQTAEQLRALPGFDENLFQHVALVALIEGNEESKAARQQFDPDALLERARVNFEASTSKGWEMLRGPLDETLALVKDLAPRVKATEDGLSEVRRELAELKLQVEALRGLEAKVADLETRLAQREGKPNVTAETPAPPKLEPSAGG